MDSFGSALRDWRERATGYATDADPRRRTPGLRRQELAGRAHISADYVARLEQGRVPPPSAQVLDALAGALGLSAEEREHFFALARRHPGPMPMNSDVPPSVERLLAQIASPAAAYDAAWTILRWNRAFANLMGDPGEWEGLERNLVYRYVSDAPGRVLQRDQPLGDYLGAYVADLRRTARRFPGDPRVGDLLSALDAASPQWAEMWARTPASAVHETRKRIRHPELGDLTFDCGVLTVDGVDVRVTLFTLPESEDALRVLAALNAPPAARRPPAA